MNYPPPANSTQIASKSPCVIWLQGIFRKLILIPTKLYIRYEAFTSLLRKEVNRIEIKRNPSLAIESLRKQGVDIATDAIFFGEDIRIDLTRPSLIHIGSHTFLHNGLRILTHDYATSVFLTKYKEFIPSSGKVWIGDNVWFGENVTVLKGAHIGNDCIIGINSIVMGNIPDGSVAAGCPARVICTLEEYFNKRKERCIEEALDYARSIQKTFGRRPVPADFWEEFPLFVSGNEVDDYPEIPIKKQLGKAYDDWTKNHRSVFNSFNDFLNAAGL